MDAIVGYLIALVLSMTGVSAFATWARIGVTNVKTAATASQMVIFDQAAQQYVHVNASTLATQATLNKPVTLHVSDLVDYLPAGFSATNPFGQVWQLQVLLSPKGQLQPLVTSQNGVSISDTKQLVQIAAQAGAAGGFVPYANQAGDASMNPAFAVGAYGGWRLPLVNYTNPGSGHLASLLAVTDPQASNNDYLYRVAVPGQPALNQMETAIDMNTNDIVNAGNVAAQGVTVQNPSGQSTVNVGAGSVSYSNATQQLSLTAASGVQITNPAGVPAQLTAGDITGGTLRPTTLATPGSLCQYPGTMATSSIGPLFCEVSPISGQAAWWATSLSWPGGYETKSNCGASNLSVPIPAGATSYQLTATGVCAASGGTACELLINGRGQFTSGAGGPFNQSVSSGWSPNAAEMASGVVKISVRSIDTGGNVQCLATYARSDITWFLEQ
ncbi:shufflon system plasmid conjugative transfer pilus tip adhesin PilV [Trinickia diaoshuihuensis]|uniref:shufflon system plasmid conjugative transfer pilus tip adhesin PilV n=1 Tax=Trinickia diaoshuihuensis TaxID=2292265 RepID=UPI000E222B6A|nr:shufflon system plasmid conjugative transfer pilus tip adhesin PilV [Trinickia diaoshuihuensis]